MSKIANSTIELPKFNPNSITEIVLDTGLLVSYLMNENQQLTSWLDRYIFNDELNVTVICNKFNFTELFYVICRKRGSKIATEILNQIKQSIQVFDDEQIHISAGLIKCQLSLALVDCFSIATAKSIDCPVLFRNEQEITDSVIKKIRTNIYQNLWLIKCEEDKIVFS